jgi:hypothetical protein
LTVAERDEVLERLAKELEAKFVFPDVAASYAKMLHERQQTKARKARRGQSGVALI